MANLYTPVSFGVPAEFASELAKAGELLDASALALQTSLEVENAALRAGADSQHKVVAAVLYAKALKSANAIQVLSRCGYGSDGLSLCAALFENLIDLLYINRAPKKHSKRYLQFENVEKLYQARKVLSAKRLPKGRRKEYRKYEKELASKVAPLLRYFPKTGKGWSQMSLNERAKKIGAGLAYQELYWIFCAHKHTLPMSAIQITSTTGAGDVIPLVTPHMLGVCDAMEQSTELILKLALVMSAIYGLGLEREIHSRANAVGSAVANLRSSKPGIFA